MMIEVKKTMLDYINEAPSIAYQNIENRKSLTNELVKLLKEKKVKRLWLIASGSSFNACSCINLFFSKLTGIEVKLITPFTFVHYDNDMLESDLAIVISQSGMSTNAIEALKKINELGSQSVCLTGNAKADVVQVADVIIDYGVQEELVGYVTKGVTLLALYFILLGVELSGDTELCKEVKKAIEMNEEVLNKTVKLVSEEFKGLSSIHQSYLCGAGSTMGVALEGALKIGETIHVPSIAYEVEEYIHGPNLQLNPSYFVIIFDGDRVASKRVKQIYEATKKITNNVFLLTQYKDDINDQDKHVICLSKELNHNLLNLAYLPFVQYLSYKISNDCSTIKQHPLLKEFKEIADAKSPNYVNYDEDDFDA